MYPGNEYIPFWNITVSGKTDTFFYFYDTFEVVVVLNVPLLSVNCTTMGYISFHHFKVDPSHKIVIMSIVGR